MIRYRVIAEAHDEQLTPAETGLPVRGLAGRGYELPGGMRKEFSRASLDQWIRAYREAGHRLGARKRTLHATHCGFLLELSLASTEILACFNKMHPIRYTRPQVSV